MRAARKEGWVLIETLVALVLLSVGVLAINRALREAMETRAIARDFTTARFLLEERISELEMQPVLREGTVLAGDFGNEHERFSYTCSVTKVEVPRPEIPPDVQAVLLEPIELPEPYLGKISVTIKWTRAGRAFDATAETLVSSRKLQTKEPVNAPQPAPA